MLTGAHGRYDTGLDGCGMGTGQTAYGGGSPWLDGSRTSDVRVVSVGLQGAPTRHFLYGKLWLMKILIAILSLALAMSAADSRDAEVQRTMTRFITSFQNLDWSAFRTCWVEHPVLFAPVPGPHGEVARADTTAAFEAFWQDQFRRSRENAATRGVTTQPYFKIEPKDTRIDYLSPTVAVVTFHLTGSSLYLGRRMFVLALNGTEWRITHLHASNLDLPKKK